MVKLLIERKCNEEDLFSGSNNRCGNYSKFFPRDGGHLSAKTGCSTRQ